MKMFATYGIDFVSKAGDHILALLVETDAAGNNRLVAEMDIDKRATKASFTATRRSWDDAVGSDNVEDMDTLGLDAYRPFRGMDPRAVIFDGAYNWILRNIAPQYSEPDLSLEDDVFSLNARSKNVGASAGTGATAGSGARKPRRSKMNYRVWI